MAAWAVDAAGERSHSGAGDLFDQEWTLVTCQMAVLGLGQLTLEHPELGDRYLPAMRSCSRWLASPTARAFGTRKWGEDVLGDDEPTGTHAYAGYAALALSLHRKVEPDPPWAADHERLLDRLEVAVDRPLPQIETYPGETYPADIAAVLGALALGGRDVDAAVADFRERAVHPSTGLLYQSFDPRSGRPRDDPRGSGTAIAAYFLAPASPALSRELTDALLDDRFLVVHGIREYPRDTSGWGDVDSGPVIMGLGVSATGFAMAGARMHGRRERFVRLHRTAGWFGLPVPTPSGRWYGSGGSLGNAILLAMMTAPRPAEPRLRSSDP